MGMRAVHSGLFCYHMIIVWWPVQGVEVCSLNLKERVGHILDAGCVQRLHSVRNINPLEAIFSMRFTIGSRGFTVGLGNEEIYRLGSGHVLRSTSGHRACYLDKETRAVHTPLRINRHVDRLSCGLVSVLHPAH